MRMASPAERRPLQSRAAHLRAAGPAALWHETDEGNCYSVDFFRGTDRVGLYLLTHAHADHVAGLFDSKGCVVGTWARRVGPRIVCSAQTKALLVARGVPSCRVEALPLLEPCAVRVGGAVGPTVTLIDANHCPGSVMFHVQWDDLDNLHTGDFRYQAELHSCDQVLGQIRDVCSIFLDTTFYDEVYAALCASCARPRAHVRAHHTNTGAIPPQHHTYSYRPTHTHTHHIRTVVGQGGNERRRISGKTRVDTQGHQPHSGAKPQGTNSQKSV